MADQAERVYDVFISYAQTDRTWVEGYLLPALGLPPERVITPKDFRPGAAVVVEFERAVIDSRYTVLVLSPAYLADEWSTFGEQLTSHASVAKGCDRLIPLLLQPCTLPLRVDFRVRLDCTDEANWEGETARLRDLLDQPEPTPERIPCPYPGMVPFRAEDARFFYGREDEIDELLRRLRHQRYLFIIGPSGSGKTSFLFAGLIPKLYKVHPDQWLVRQLRPGPRPLDTLRQVLGVEDASDVADWQRFVERLLAQHPPCQRLLLVIDQLEELFAQVSKAEQTTFIAAIHVLQEVQACTLLLTLRADFYPDLMTSDLWPVQPAERLDIAPLRGDALRDAITLPAQRQGVYLEAGLLERLLADAAEEPGVLPLVQETMQLLWGQMERRLLPLKAYQRLGGDGRSGLAVAVATKADATLAELSSEQQSIARRIFLRLVQFGEGRADTRRRQPLSALRAAGDEPDLFDQTLRHLMGHRLLTLSGEEGDSDRLADLAHEALISGWPTFQKWLTERREEEQIRRRLVSDVKEWERRDRDGFFLYEGTRLKPAQEWAAQNESELNQALSEFLAASKRREIRRRALQRFIQAVVVLFAILGLISVGQALRVNLLRLQARGEMVNIPAGTALLGTDDQNIQRACPQREVELAAFSLHKYEVSNRQYGLCVKAGVCDTPITFANEIDFEEEDPRLPVTWVTAFQAAKFCRWIGGRLPTEAEWERAARGSDGRPWPWGNENPTPQRVNLFLPEYGNSVTNTVRVDAPYFIGGATPEPEAGIMHLLGNVWEWTSTPTTCDAAYDCPTAWDGESEVKALYLRGMSWQDELANDPSLVSLGKECVPFGFADDVGFRCAGP